MRIKRLSLVLIVAAGLLLLTGALALRDALPAVAQTSASYDLTWNVVAGGGEPMSSAHYVVRSTSGQPGASPPYSAHGEFVVSGGYWYGSGPPDVVYDIYLPMILRGYP
jgi:hypothetical protein